MKQLFFFLTTVIVVLAACTDNDTAKQSDAKTEPGQRTEICYTGKSGKDSVILAGHIDGDKIKGILDFKFSEKDLNTGFFSGIIIGDTLIADYTFASEGTQSVRQVAFLKKDNSLIEGYGDMEEKDGKMVFKNTGSIRFGDGFILKKIECN
jgi:hypothetical protein